ncbi:MAG: hypothetical protein MPW16_14825 [Candidatus Manganitrophus sp.]|nr:MAG: hypothetical protein MPW16_14825 [Candidatus Manganitrophus sp.]
MSAIASSPALPSSTPPQRGLGSVFSRDKELVSAQDDIEKSTIGIRAPVLFPQRGTGSVRLRRTCTTTDRVGDEGQRNRAEEPGGESR